MRAMCVCQQPAKELVCDTTTGDTPGAEDYATVPDDYTCQKKLTVATDKSADTYETLQVSGADFTAATCELCVKKIFSERKANNGKAICLPQNTNTPVDSFKCKFGRATVFDETLSPDRFDIVI
jgi:hypothetical protein